MKIITFRRFWKENWEIAFNEMHLHTKLNGEMAEIVMPEKSFLVRLWRMVFPLKGIECHVTPK